MRRNIIDCLLHDPNQGFGLQPRHVPWPVIEPATSVRGHSWSTEPHQSGLPSVFKKISLFPPSPFIDLCLYPHIKYTYEHIYIYIHIQYIIFLTICDMGKLLTWCTVNTKNLSAYFLKTKIFSFITIYNDQNQEINNDIFI